MNESPIADTPEKTPNGDTVKQTFSSVTLKLERRGPCTFRVVFERVQDDTRTVEKSEWLPRHRMYAHLAERWKLVRAFAMHGMGRVPA